METIAGCEPHLSWHLQVALDHCPTCRGSHCQSHKLTNARANLPARGPTLSTARRRHTKALGMCSSVMMGQKSLGAPHPTEPKPAACIAVREHATIPIFCEQASRLQLPRMGSLYLSDIRSRSKNPLAAHFVVEQLKGRVRQTMSEGKCRREVRVPSGPVKHSKLTAIHRLTDTAVYSGSCSLSAVLRCSPRSCLCHRTSPTDSRPNPGPPV